MRRQQFYRSASRPSVMQPPPPPGGAGRAGGAFLLVMLAFGGALAGFGYWPPWSLFTGQDAAPADSADALRPTESIEPQRTTTQPVLTRAVTIAPVAMQLLGGPPSGGLPMVVTPGSPIRVAAAAATLVQPPRMPAAAIPAVLRLPSGSGPFPAVILLHGCGGPFTGTPAWAYRLNAWGYAALMPDSLTPRGVQSVCDPDDQPKVTPWDRVGDVGAAAAWLRSQPDIDPSRIAVLGLSHGGTTAALAVQTPYAGIRLRAAIDYYGPCMEPRLQGAVPLLVLAGEADDWGNPAKACRAYGKALRPDQPFEIHTYPGVFHGFDSGSSNPVIHTGHVLQHDQGAADDSFLRVHAFLDRWVKP